MKKIRDQVPYCAGRNFPKYHIPKGACDCHHHIYDPVRYAYQPSDTRNQPPSTVDVYRMLQKKLGLSRNVIVQPSAYGTDNRCTLDALRAMGKEQTRAIVVVDESVTDADLTAYHDQGVRGIRFNINCGYSGDWTKIERLAERIAHMGWSACFWMPADLLMEMKATIENLPCHVVLDHRGHIPAGSGKDHPAFPLICEWLKEGKVYVKLSGLYIDTKTEQYKEVIQIGKESGVKIHYSHFKVCGRKNWDKIDGMIQLLEEAEKEGIDVSFDQYPYVAGSTMLGVILPPWVHDGGTNKVIERLNDPELRKKMVYDIEHGIPGWDNFVDFAGLDQIYVTSVKTDKNKDAVGLSLTELGKLRGKDPYDATFDLLRDEENAVGMVDFYGTEDHVKLFMKRPEMNVCTDGLLGGKPHPRVYGAFPRVLGKYVREDKALTLEQAVYKMTGKPAATFNIKNRGQIKEGAYADITVFNPDTVIDKGTFTDPTQYPEGIEYVMVNGVFEVAGGKYTGRRNGTVLRKKGKEVVK